MEGYELLIKPKKDGMTTKYKCGLIVIGSWRTRLEQHEIYCNTLTGKYILELEEKLKI